MALGASVAVVYACALSAAPAPADAAVDPERMSPTVTLHSEGVKRTAAQVDAAVDPRGQRVTDIDVHSGAPPLFDYTAVTNFGAGNDLYKGPYGREWDWTFGLTGAQLAQVVSSGNWRILDLEPYLSGDQRRYAAVFVKNTGEAGKAWWYYLEKTPAEIEALAAANGARVVDIDPVTSTTRSVVMVAKTGADQIESELFFGRSMDELIPKLRKNNLRPIDVEPSGAVGSSYDVIAVPAENTQWSWKLRTPQEVAAGAAPAERPYDLDFVEGGSNGRYSVLSLNPPRTEGSGSESQRILTRFEHYFPGGEYEFYAKRVGGKPVSGHAIDAVHEPASAVKVLAMLYALRQIDLGNANTGTSVQWIDYGTPCTPGQTTTLAAALAPMMQQSNNSATHGVVAHFGNANINSYAQARGWTSMRIRGCGLESGRSDWSSRDAVDLYEQMSTGSTFDNPPTAELIESTMSASRGFFTDALQEEAGSGKAFTRINNRMGGVWKGGSLGWCLPAPASCAAGHYEHRTFAGTLELPFRKANGPGIAMRAYAFEWTAEDFLPCSYKGASETLTAYYARCPEARLLDQGYDAMTAEVARKPIRQAVRSFAKK